jgi:hypothetical protein
MALPLRCGRVFGGLSIEKDKYFQLSEFLTGFGSPGLMPEHVPEARRMDDHRF